MAFDLDGDGRNDVVVAVTPEQAFKIKGCMYGLFVLTVVVGLPVIGCFNFFGSRRKAAEEMETRAANAVYAEKQATRKQQWTAQHQWLIGQKPIRVEWNQHGGCLALFKSPTGEEVRGRVDLLPAKYDRSIRTLKQPASWSRSSNEVLWLLDRAGMSDKEMAIQDQAILTLKVVEFAEVETAAGYERDGEPTVKVLLGP